MNRHFVWLLTGMICATAVGTNAGERSLFRFAAQEFSSDPSAIYAVPPAPMPDGYIGGSAVGGIPVEGVPLYHNVKYTDTHEIAPCAVPKIISVLDPCACSDPCSCCGPKCVYVKICVPPCACEDVKVRRHGKRIRYAYGKYAVDVRVKRDHIQVDYQD